MTRRIASLLCAIHLAFCFYSSQVLGGIRSYKDLDPKDLDFYLITIGLGDSLHTRFGHSILRIVDRESGIEGLLNWGLFDFRDPMFVPKFLGGTMDYKVGSMSRRSLNYLYKKVEKRSVWENQIFLTEPQKAILLKRINWNLRAENINYRYQYFFDNCSTKIRDYLDEALGGAIKSSLGEQDTGRSYRYFVRANLNHPPPIAFGLDVLMNGDIDRRLTQWDEMFLPEKLMFFLEEFQIEATEGGGTLLGPRITHYTSPGWPSPDWDFYHVYSLGFGLPLAWIIAFLAFSVKPGPRKAIYRLSGIFVVLGALLSGFFGIFMTFGWLFSEHSDLHRNWNLMIFWPVDWVFIYLGSKLLIFGRRVESSLGFRRVLKVLSISHLLAIGLGTLLYLSGQIGQDLSRVVVFLVPVMALYYVGCIRYWVEEK